MSDEQHDDERTFFIEAFSVASRANPYDLYREWRGRGAMVRAGDDMHLAFGHDACWTMLRHPAASSDERRGTDFRRQAENDPRVAALMTAQQTLLFMDPPDHTRLRALVARGFSPRRVEQLRAVMQDTTDRLLAAVAHRVADGDDTVDIVEALAYPLPIAVICRMLGVPLADQELFGGWSVALTKSVDPAILRSEADELAIVEASAALNEYTAALLEERRRQPGDDLLSVLLGARDEHGSLDDAEMIELVTLLLVAGHETTVNLIGNGLLALVDHPDQMTVLRADPSITSNAVDELLRYDSPLQFVIRIATAEMVVADTTLAEGDEVIVVLGSANRDPAVFGDPDRLDLRRANANRHVSFGGGIHHCLGAALARAEADVALTSLLRQFPHIERAGEPTLRDTLNLRGRSHIPVVLGT